MSRPLRKLNKCRLIGVQRRSFAEDPGPCPEVPTEYVEGLFEGARADPACPEAPTELVEVFIEGSK